LRRTAHAATLLLFVSFSFAATVPATPASATSGPTIQDLGQGFNGGDLDIKALNNLGDSVGASYDNGNTTTNPKIHGVLWDHQTKTLTDLGNLGGITTTALGINDAKHIVGYSTESSGNERAFIWQNGSMHDLGTLPFGNHARASAINNHGQIIGSSDTFDVTCGCQIDKAVTWDANGTISDLGALAGGDTRATAINDLNQVVGESMVANGWHTFLWDNGAMTDLSPQGINDGQVTGINSRNQIIGSYFSNGQEKGFLWQNGVRRDLKIIGPDYGGRSQSSPYGINSSGEVVGWSSGYGIPGSIPVIWAPDGSIVDIQQTFSGQLSGISNYVVAVNSNGQFVGSYSGPSGVEGGYLGFVPVPAPPPPPPAVTLVGKVTDSQTGSGIPNIYVTAFPTSQPQGASSNLKVLTDS
jgi:probable HAF family extracellular repeat protein